VSFPAEQNGFYELVQDTGKPVFASVAPTSALSYRKLPNTASLDRCCAIIGFVLLVAEAFLVRLGQDILASCLGRGLLAAICFMRNVGRNMPGHAHACGLAGLGVG